MTVRLIALTHGAGELAGRSAEDVIVYTARVSNPSNQMNFETSPKLLKYCIDQKHWSIFQQADMTLEIETSRGIAAQLLRHRSANFQEASQRYSKVLSYICYPARRQDKKNRQNSIDDMSNEDKSWFQSSQEKVWDLSYSLYEEALKIGIAKEQARFLLPLNTKTVMYMKMTCRDWIHYIQVRTDPSTQKEHRDIAEGCKTVFCQVFPNTAEALGW